MAETKENLEFSGRSLETLAQSATQQPDKLNSESVHTLYGEGADAKLFKKRARRKFLCQQLMYALIDVAKEHNDFEMVQKFWNTWHCQSDIMTHNHRAYGKYCKNRWCNVCCGIRKAEMMHKYKPVISTWSEARFQTLSSQSVTKEYLNAKIDLSREILNKIIKKYNQRFRRNGGHKLVGLFSLECNFNPIAKTYNPHFHIITKDIQTAHLLNWEWLLEWKKIGPDKINEWAQVRRRVNDTDKCLIETIKYVSKTMTDPDMKKGDKVTKNPVVYANALYHIYKAFSNRRLLSTFGFSLPKQDYKKTKIQHVTDVRQWKYKPYQTDYVDIETGEMMLNYIPSNELVELMKSNINTDLN